MTCGQQRRGGAEARGGGAKTMAFPGSGVPCPTSSQGGHGSHTARAHSWLGFTARVQEDRGQRRCQTAVPPPVHTEAAGSGTPGPSSRTLGKPLTTPPRHARPHG